MSPPDLELRRDVPLSELTTMRLGGPATLVTEVHDARQLGQAVEVATSRGLELIVLGSGSNVIAADIGFEGLVILNRIRGVEVLAEDSRGAELRVGAGEIWDDICALAVERGLQGIEAMSAIPGTMGAAPVQNIGAYGQELAETVVAVEALDLLSGDLVLLSPEACGFGYRTSIFKRVETRRHIVTAVTLRLSRRDPRPPFYASLAAELERRGIEAPSLAEVRDAVIAVRATKLPDPTRVANSGSFFKNPVVGTELLDRVRAAAAPAEPPHYPQPDGTEKLAAGWLIEAAGMRGHAAHGMRTWDANALVLVNDGTATYAGLDAFRGEIRDRVRERFGIELEQEPDELGG
ncbi:UDP-N-acetylmuramate dehydrogenase [Thermoleophilia bacterium SCSIO 60948]|nr:UDP-N-acetylmuramate dehydrogenase [Thermoleophilia bacterium SCSIO 60948]